MAWDDPEYDEAVRRLERERVARLEAELEEARAEIVRHHRDFARWEEMADKGAALIEENRRLRERNEHLEEQARQMSAWINSPWD